MSHLFHDLSWQLIVNEFPSYAKALNLLGFLKKTAAHTHITRILHVQTRICYAYTSTYGRGWACATGGCMRSMYVQIHR